VDDFLASHERIFVIEQNRDAQLRTLLMAENGGDPYRLIPILHYDGTPITARFIVASISSLMDATQPPGSRPLREAAE
jgi:2-oxoglutarate ferredoxin oxidoreductase subunit alpha